MPLQEEVTGLPEIIRQLENDRACKNTLLREKDIRELLLELSIHLANQALRLEKLERKELLGA